MPIKYPTVRVRSGVHTIPGLMAVGIDKEGPKFLPQDVDDSIRLLIYAENYFEGHAKMIENDAGRAIQRTEEATAGFSEAIDKFAAVRRQLADEAKQASGSVRDAAEKLAQGLARVEKAANFDRLERLVGLLERAAAAMETLAELEEKGRLSKIADAIR